MPRDKPAKVLLVSSHPVQYAAPLYRRYAGDQHIDLTVAFCSLAGAKANFDADFGQQIQWDVPLLHGYSWIHPPNRSLRPNIQRFWGLLNPGIWTVIRSGRFDVVVCYGYRAASFWVAAAAARLSGSSLVFTTDAHSLASRDRRWWKALAKRHLLKWVFRSAEAVFVPSTRGQRFLETLGVAPERVFLTPYAVENGFFSDRSSRVDVASVRERWQVPLGAVVALFCAKLAPWKRPFDLLRAAARVDGLWVVYAGDGTLRRELELQAHDLGVADRVRFLGFVNQLGLPEVYAAADLLVLPSEYEPFGVVVNEAFACGRPAIVSNACGAAGDLVREDETGFVVPVGDVDALAERLRWLQSHPEIRRRMGERALERVAAWGPEQNREAFVEACLTLMYRKEGR